MFNFYQINEDDEIRTRDCLVIKALIPYQRTISTKKLKLLGEVREYNLYYSLTDFRFLEIVYIIFFLYLVFCFVFDSIIQKCICSKKKL